MESTDRLPACRNRGDGSARRRTYWRRPGADHQVGREGAVNVTTEEILFEKEGALAWVTFNRPQARNAMTWNMYSHLEEYCDRIEQDPEIRVAILRGAGGKAFVAGTDIGQFADFVTPQHAIDYETRMDRIIGRLERVTKPTIALLEGYTVGGGATIAMACDFRYATPDLKFGAPIARTLGNTLSMANFARLVDLLGPGRAKEVMMLAKLVEAQDALAAGLVNEVVEADRIEARVREVADQLCGHAPLTLRAIKESVRRIQEARRVPPEIGEDLIVSCYMSEDFRGAVRAFLNKEKWVWRGR